MDKDILTEVIAAEKDIQSKIETEQAKLREWLDQVKREAEAEIAREEQNDSEARGRAIEAAKQEATARAQAVIAEAEEQSRWFERIDDRSLADIVMKRIPRILME